jgi:hypothetical protein
MRNYLYIDVMPSWSKDKEVLAVFKEILTRRYVSLTDMREYAYMFFKGLAPEVLLKKLHKENEKLFPFKGILRKKKAGGIEVDYGYFNYTYVPKMLEYMGVEPKKIALYDLADDGSLHTSAVDGDMQVVDNKKTEGLSLIYMRPVLREVMKRRKGATGKPDIVVVYANQVFTDRSEIGVRKKDTMVQKKFTVGETAEIDGARYRCDSVLLTNYNYDTCASGHDIAGVTCGGGRFIYNGWVRRTVDPAKLVKHKAAAARVGARGPDIATISDIPCEIMPFDWLKNNGDFCLSTTACALRMRSSKNSLCFNIDKSPRTYVFVREELCKRGEAPIVPERGLSADGSASVGATAESGAYLQNLSAEMAFTPESAQKSKARSKKPRKTKTDKDCPPGKIVNPATHRCVKIDGAIGRRLAKAGAKSGL